MVARFALIALLLALLWGCAAPTPAVRTEAGFTPRPEKAVLYVVPFTTVMVPPEVEEGVFDLFVDALNDAREDLGYEFVILKGGLAGVPAEWLASQHYLTGEVFGYIEESGCCSTAIRVKSRVQLHQPGTDAPTLRLDYPRELFFDHDYSTVEVERAKLAADLAATLSDQLLSALSGH